MDETVSFSAGSDPDIVITCNETSILVEKRKSNISLQTNQPSIEAGSFHRFGRLLNQFQNVRFNFYPVILASQI